ncbi:hypothetical protein T4D_9678 [Trichinella pseudospiralis]|uniref:Uncharacterized protein n=1 Tax=Trichinella pseudospiralis TaxID=6337 RepID=A0A0V1FA36_TRIPS|nr:hypothetical protein T4D_9678 [Trichinella pseudospiralis]
MTSTGCEQKSRGCRSTLSTNLDATKVIRTSEHAKGCRVDAHAFYHHQQLGELRRLATENLRPVMELRYRRVLSSVGPGAVRNVQQPGSDFSTFLPSRRQQQNPERSAQVYSRIFEVLHSKAAELDVQLDLAKFVCDSETALIPAIKGNFPNTRVQGSF